VSGPTATVRVRLVVEVRLTSSWGADCTLGQIHRQGTQESVEALQRVLGDAKMRIVEATACDVVVHSEGKP
jgi:hypothetical protein